jgi:hypothetical protein
MSTDFDTICSSEFVINYYEKYTVVEDKFLNNTLYIDHLKELQDEILNCLNNQSNVLF